MLTLYSYFRSSTSYRVRMALALKGLEYKLIPVNLVKGEHRGSEYVGLNPQGRVPTLVHNDFVLGQSQAIIEYLDDIAPEPRLVFGTGEQKAYIRQISQAISCDIHPVTNLNVLQHLVKTFGADEAQKNAWYAHFASSGVAAVEDLLAQRGWHGDFCLGNQISMADLCLIPQMYNLRRYKIPTDAYPLCCKIEANCIKLKPFQVAAPEAQPDVIEGLEHIHGAQSPLL